MTGLIYSFAAPEAPSVANATAATSGDVSRREKTYKNGLVTVVSSGNIFDSVPPGETFIEKGQIVYHTLQIFGTMIRDNK